MWVVVLLVLILSGLYANQVTGAYLEAQVHRVGQTLMELPRWVVMRLGASSAWGCRAEPGCEVRTVAAPTGYSGLVSLGAAVDSAFVVAASPFRR